VYLKPVLRPVGGAVSRLLKSERSPVPDVPAVYFIEPNTDNIRQVGEDLKRKLYNKFYINFSSSVPRPILEELANVAIDADTSRSIVHVYDQYLSFLSLESNLFSLGFEDSYIKLNDPQANDTSIEEAVDRTVNGLFSVLATLGCIPIIRCPRGNAAEMVAKKLDSKLRDHLMDMRDNLFQQDPSSLASLRRPGRLNREI
jgi:sec1 family domain-containing protein 1